MSHPSEGIEYTVIIRLPFARGDFEDPTSVPWNTSQDQQLWKQLSQTSNCSDLNWEAMSKRFGVPLEFLGRQAAWLYERHFQGVKAQMRRLSVGESSRGERLVEHHLFHVLNSTFVPANHLRSANPVHSCHCSESDCTGLGRGRQWPCDPPLRQGGYFANTIDQYGHAE